MPIAQRGMGLSSIGDAGLSHVADLTRLTGTPPRDALIYSNLRCSVFSAKKYMKKADVGEGPFSKESWLIAIHLLPDQVILTGDTFVNVRYAVSGKLFHDRLYAAYIQPLGRYEYNIWANETVITR